MILSTYSSPPSPTRCNDEVDIGFGYCSPHHVLGYYYCSPHHRQAQRLNNTAVTCIIAMEENGGHRNRKGGQPKQQQINQHEKAISILEKALRICEREEDQEHDYAYDVCSCYDCSIDGCIVFSSEKDSSEHDDHHADNDKFVSANEDNDNDGSTIYSHPMYVHEGHNMGSAVLHTIIQFNLALAYHLQCLCLMEATTNNENKIKNNEIKNEKSESDIINININKALQFYEVACDDNLSTTRSIRFDTIICNNLCHIYRYQDQTEKEEDEQHYYQQQQQVTQQQQQPITTVTDNEEEEEDDNDDGISSSWADMADDRIEMDYYRQEEKEQGKYERNNTSPPSLPVSIERSLWALLPDFQ